MSFSATSGPIGWSSSRYGYCMSRVSPSSKQGMFINMRKNLSAKLKDHQSKNEQQKYENYSKRYQAYLKLLERQKVPQITFTGNPHLCSPRDYTRMARDVSERLHRTVNIYQPAEARPRRRPGEDKTSDTTPQNNRHSLINKPIYTRAEISRILDSLSQNESKEETSSKGEDDHVDEKTTKIKKETMKKFNKSHLYYPASEVEEAMEDFVNQTKKIQQQNSARSSAHAPLFHKVSCDEKTNKREHKKKGRSKTPSCHDNDEASNSGGRQSRRVKSAPPETSRFRKTVTQKELDEIVERLHHFDDTRWPPESRNSGRISVYQ